ncbi:hypothetical protein ACJ73_01426 [Blastomyces percursus]|uniref:PNPLA domain-containing protein n=1 Tax=Blastomyces percursus TaxID=1658174 RepID=A0A1J9QFC7_9EURO|nr:hypothetical protein ACJ73_01426 [Blastomyces percursus]
MNEAQPEELAGDLLNNSGLCLLSLDGGGVRGLSSLRILQGLMERVNHERAVVNLPSVKPCDLFDLIGGTSTGGLIAIMLGRLEMDVDQCIAEYSRMIQQIFKKKSFPVDWKGKVKGRFDTGILTNSLRETLLSLGVSAADSLNDGEERKCRVFVCATAFETKSIIRLKSYRLPGDANLSPTILDAARATSAATSFFEPAAIGTRRYVDGALGANNPVDEVWNEAQNIWCADDGALEPLVNCFISIGTGNPGVSPMNEGALKMLATDMVKMATQTERTAETFQARHRGLFDRERYFRFNVAQGLQTVGLEEYKKQGLLEAATDDYLTSTEQRVRLRNCVKRLNEKKVKSPIDLVARMRSYDELNRERRTASYTNIYLSDPAFVQNPNFTGRQNEIHAIHQHFVSAKEKKLQGRVCLWGPGGVGKTQLAAAYSLSHKQHYSHILKVSARSFAALQEDFAKIIYEVTSHAGVDARKDPTSEAKTQMSQAEIQENIHAVHRWFSDHQAGDWLLIIDDVSLAGVNILGFIPRTETGNVLITSQSREIGGYGHLIPLEDLDLEDAVTLLLNKANIHDEELRTQIRPRATEIVKCLGYRALAVEHAGALIGCKGIEYYWNVFNLDRTAVLDHPEITSIHQESVFTTFKLSFGVLMEKNHAAAVLLTFLACLDNTTISEHLLIEGGKRRKSLPSLQIFETRLEFVNSVADLHALALVYYSEGEDGIMISLHPLVHYMSRARLKPFQRVIHTTHAAYFLLWPILFRSSTESPTSHSSFKHLLQVLQQAMDLTEEPLSSVRHLQLWTYLAQLLISYYPYWHVSGKVGDLFAIGKRAVSVLEFSTGEHNFTSWAWASIIVSQASEFIPSGGTSYTSIKVFLGKQLNPRIALALDFAARVDEADPSPSHLVLPRIGFGPMTLRRILKRKPSEWFVSMYAKLLREGAWQCMRRKLWHEGLLLATLSELPTTFFDRQHLARFTISPSQVVKDSFTTFSNRDIEGLLEILKKFGQDGEDHVTRGARYDLGKILATKGQYTEAEVIAMTLTAQYSGDSKLAIPTFEGTFYTWANKLLAICLAGQGKLSDARDLLVDVYNTVYETSKGNHLGPFHASYLMVLFHTRFRLHFPKDISDYRREVSEVLRRIYAADKPSLLSGEGLATGCLLLSQGALDEAAFFFQELSELSTEILGVDHPQTQHTAWLLDTAVKEREQEAEYKNNGDFWIHFGCMTFQREVSIFSSPRSFKPVVGAREQQISWEESAKWSPSATEGKFSGKIYGIQKKPLLFLMAAGSVLLVCWFVFTFRAKISTVYVLTAFCTLGTTVLILDIVCGFEVSSKWIICWMQRPPKPLKTKVRP